MRIFQASEIRLGSQAERPPKMECWFVSSGGGLGAGWPGIPPGIPGRGLGAGPGWNGAGKDGLGSAGLGIPGSGSAGAGRDGIGVSCDGPGWGGLGSAGAGVTG